MDAISREGITLAIALLGAVLGIINLWRAFDRDRVRVRVLPRSYVTSHGDGGLCIEVINVGYIPITISQVGFDLSIRGKIFLHASLLKDLPKRLEPRTAFTAYLATGGEQDPAFAKVTRAFAKTACGCRFAANSKALSGVVKVARASAKKAPR